MSKPEAPAQPPTKEDLEQLCALAQTAFYALLGATAFFAVVILSTTDSDFLVGSKQTEIPLIRISAPTERFFFLAPIVTTVLYCQLHLYCIKLWTATRDAPLATVQSVGSKSLVADLMLYLFPDKAARPRGGDNVADVGTIVAALLIWVAHPALLLWALARTQAASRINWMSVEDHPHLAMLLPSTVHGATVLCLSLSCAIGIASFLAALAIRWRRLAAHPLGIAAIAAAFLLPFATSDRLARAQFRPVAIDRENLVGIDGDWPRAAERRAQYQDAWCKDRGVDRGVCAKVPSASRDIQSSLGKDREAYCSGKGQRPGRCNTFFEKLDADFLADWKTLRTAELARLPQLDLARRNLDNATALGTKFNGARMEHASLRGAGLKEADFEGADLLAARLDGAEVFYATLARANLTGAGLSLTNLTSSNLETTTLKDADLRGASLVNATLIGANLQGADLRAANLSDAKLAWADFTGASLDGAVLADADLTGATGLTQGQLDAAVGTAVTRLPMPGEGKPPLMLTSCWGQLPAVVGETLDALPDGPRKAVALQALDEQRCGRTESPSTFIGPPRRALPPVMPDLASYQQSYLEGLKADRARVEAARPRKPPPPLSGVALRPQPRPPAYGWLATISTRNAPQR